MQQIQINRNTLQSFALVLEVVFKYKLRMKLLCESDTSGGHQANAPSAPSSGPSTGNGGRSGGGGGLKLGIVRLGRAAGKVGLMIYNKTLK